MQTPSQQYASLQPFVQKDVEDMVNKLLEEKMTQMQYEKTKEGPHAHTGLDALRINPKDLLGFPIVAGVPQHKAQNGTWTFVVDNLTSPTLYYLYVFFNGQWNNLSYHL